jgi:hypothetical protein
MGNASYADAPLRNPVNDAQAMTAQLRYLGFDATVRTNVTKRALDESVRSFVATLRPDGIAVVFFSGHGLQHDGMSYLLPVDADIDRDVDIRYEAYPAQRLVDAVAESGVRLSIIVLDACRANAVRIFRGAGVAGLAPLSTVSFRSVRRRPQDYAIVYATEPGDVAADSAGGRHSPFTQALIASLRVPGLSLDEVMHRTTATVNRTTRYGQRPVAHMSLTGRHVLHPDGGPPSGGVRPAAGRPQVTPKPPPKPERPRPRPASSGTGSVDLEDWLRLTTNEVGSEEAGSFAWATVGGRTASASADVTAAHMALVLTVSMRNGGNRDRIAGDLRKLDHDTLSAVLDHLPNDLYLELEDLVFESGYPSRDALEQRWLAERRYDRLAWAVRRAVRSGADPERIAGHLLELEDDVVTEVLDRLPDEVRAALEDAVFDDESSPE